MAEWVGRYVKTENTSPAAARQKTLDKMNRIVIRQLEFRSANIADVIKYLDQASIACDKDSPPSEKGVNIILQLKPRDAATSTNLPTITTSLRNVVLMDAIKYVTEVTGLKYRIEENRVIITTSDVVYGELVTRTYRVQPSIAEIFLSDARSGSGEGEKKELGGAVPTVDNGDVRKFFVDAGVPFPEGTSIFYKPSLNLLTVKNTVENLDKFERILQSLNIVQVQVKVQADHVEITDPEAAQRFQRQAPTAEELRNLPSTAFRRHSSLAVITKSGANAESKSLATSDGGLATIDNQIGTVLNCTPYVGPDGYTVDLTMIWYSNVLISTNSTLHSNMALTQSLSIWDGQAMVLPVQYHRPDHLTEQTPSGNPHYVIATVTLIDPAGQPINKEHRFLKNVTSGR
jgi:hypothetical protein